jgi:hypothetical protein
LKVNRNCDKKRLTGAVFLDVAKALDTVWVKGLRHKVTLLYSLPFPDEIDNFTPTLPNIPTILTASHN